jgi:microcin C transport system substrate-binding protein
MRSKNLNDPWYQDWYHQKFSRLTVYDQLTFAVTLKELRPDAIYLIGYSNPIPKHFFTEFGPGWERPYNWRFEPTPGAYIIRDQDLHSQVSVTFTHLPHWWAENKKFMKGRYNADKIRVVAVHDPDKAFEEFTRGDIDLFPLTTQLWYNRLPDTAPTVQSGFTVKATVYHQIPVPDYALWLNEDKPLLNNRDIRVGIQYSMNVDLVCKQYFHGDAVQQQTRSDGYGWKINPSVQSRPFDPAQARAAFARAGFTHQGPDGILANDQGQRLSFTITSMYKIYNDVLVILKQEAVKAGLEINIESPDQTTGWEKLMEKRHEIGFTAFSRTVELYPRYWDFDHSMNAYDQAFLADGHTPNPSRKLRQQTDNITSLANPVIDELINRYDKTTTMDELKPIAAELEQKLWDDAGWVGLWKLPFYRVGYRPWIKWPDDFTPMQSLDYLQYWTMWVDTDEQKADLEAKSEGRPLPKQVLVYDKYKEK